MSIVPKEEKMAWVTCSQEIVTPTGIVDSVLYLLRDVLSMCAFDSMS